MQAAWKASRHPAADDAVEVVWMNRAEVHGMPHLDRYVFDRQKISS